MPERLWRGSRPSVARWARDPVPKRQSAILCARLAEVRSVQQARQQLSGFLLRHRHHDTRPVWTRCTDAGSEDRSSTPCVASVLEDCTPAVEAGPSLSVRNAGKAIRSPRTYKVLRL